MPLYEKCVVFGAECTRRLWNASTDDVWCRGLSLAMSLSSFSSARFHPVSRTVLCLAHTKHHSEVSMKYFNKQSGLRSFLPQDCQNEKGINELQQPEYRNQLLNKEAASHFLLIHTEP